MVIYNLLYYRYPSIYKSNRNLVREKNLEIRRELLQKDRVQIVAYISRLSQTKHDFDSFTVDAMHLPTIQVNI